MNGMTHSGMDVKIISMPSPFVKGYTPWNKGKTYEELYGEDRADEIKARASARLKGKESLSKQWWENLSKEEKARISKERSERALQHNAQRGRPHKNRQGVSEGVRKWWDRYGRENWRGEGNPNWKGGPKKLPYASDEWRQAAGLARRRDYNTCQDCGQVGDRPKNRIEVHHIDEDAWNHDLDNLVTLCRICHGYRHGKRMMKRTKYNNLAA